MRKPWLVLFAIVVLLHAVAVVWAYMKARAVVMGGVLTFTHSEDELRRLVKVNTLYNLSRIPWLFWLAPDPAELKALDGIPGGPNPPETAKSGGSSRADQRRNA
jgi:hypothetical protein